MVNTDKDGLCSECTLTPDIMPFNRSVLLFRTTTEDPLDVFKSIGDASG